MNDVGDGEVIRHHVLPAPVTWDAHALSSAIHAREISCREVMTAYLDHIEICNPVVNAIVSLRDRGALLKDADGRDRLLTGGESLGWMHGFPLAEKNLRQPPD